MNKQWYEVSINFTNGNRMYICQFDKELGKNILIKKEDEFIKLINVRWFDCGKIKNKRL